MIITRFALKYRSTDHITRGYFFVDNVTTKSAPLECGYYISMFHTCLDCSFLLNFTLCST